MLHSPPLTSSSRRKRFGPKSRNQRAKLAHAASRGADAETIDNLRATLDVVRAVEAYEGASTELVEVVSDTPEVDYDALVADWPELSDSARDKLALLLRGAGRE